MTLPLYLRLELSEMENSEIELWELCVAVPGSNQSTTVAIIRYDLSEPGCRISIRRIDPNGLGVISRLALQRLLISIFRFAYGVMIRDDGSAIECWRSDVSDFLSRRLTPNDLYLVSASLASFVAPSIVIQDMTVVRID